MNRTDDRTDAQQQTHILLWVGTDTFLSGTLAGGGKSIAAWACREGDSNACESWVRSRSDMSRVRQVLDTPGSPYRPKAAHLHIYVFRPHYEKATS